jgi:hypothetical protein
LSRHGVAKPDAEKVQLPTRYGEKAMIEQKQQQAANLQGDS